MSKFGEKMDSLTLVAITILRLYQSTPQVKNCMVVPATDARDRLDQDMRIAAIVDGPANAPVSLPGRASLEKP